jgi:IS30 family transposase
MGRYYPHLNLEERRKLAKWLEAKIPVKEIADNLQRGFSSCLSRGTHSSYPCRSSTLISIDLKDALACY